MTQAQAVARGVEEIEFFERNLLVWDEPPPALPSLPGPTLSTFTDQLADRPPAPTYLEQPVDYSNLLHQLADQLADQPRASDPFPYRPAA